MTVHNIDIPELADSYKAEKVTKIRWNLLGLDRCDCPRCWQGPLPKLYDAYLIRLNTDPWTFVQKEDIIKTNTGFYSVVDIQRYTGEDPVYEMLSWIHLQLFFLGEQNSKQARQDMFAKYGEFELRKYGLVTVILKKVERHITSFINLESAVTDINNKRGWVLDKL